MFIHDSITIDIVKELNNFLLLQQAIGEIDKNITCKHLFEEQFFNLADYAAYLKENGCLGVKLDFIPLLDEGLIETLNPKGNLVMLYFPTAVELCQIYVEDGICKIEPLYLHLGQWSKPLDFNQACEDYEALLQAIYNYTKDKGLTKYTTIFEAALEILQGEAKADGFVDSKAALYIQSAQKAWVFDAELDWFGAPSDDQFHEYFGTELEYIIYWMILVAFDYSVEKFLENK